MGEEGVASARCPVRRWSEERRCAVVLGGMSWIPEAVFLASNEVHGIGAVAAGCLSLLLPRSCVAGASCWLGPLFDGLCEQESGFAGGGWVAEADCSVSLRLDAIAVGSPRSPLGLDHLHGVGLDSGNQDRGINLEPVGDLDDGLEPDTLHAAFRPPEVGEVHPALLGCSLQTPPTVLSDASKTGTELCCWS